MVVSNLQDYLRVIKKRRLEEKEGLTPLNKDISSYSVHPIIIVMDTSDVVKIIQTFELKSSRSLDILIYYSDF